MAVRQLKFDGTLVSDSATATVTVNGIEAFSGELGVGQPMNQPIELCIAEYRGSTIDVESITIELVVNSGVIRVGTIWNDSPDKTPPWNWPNEGGINDGRSNILINGQPPAWPEPDEPHQPLGTKENPGWAGWNFELSAGDTFSCNYLTTNWANTQELIATRYRAPV